MDFETGGAAAGSVADLIGTAASAGDSGAEAAPLNGDGATGSTEGTAIVDPDWYGNLSADGGDADNPSNRDYAKAKGFKTLDDLVKSYRGAEKAIHDTGRIKLPGEDAKPDEIAAYRKAIGVPDDVKGYAIAAPKDASGNDIALNEPLIAALSESALKAGLPKAGFEAVVSDFIKTQLDEAADADAKGRAAAEQVVKTWGAEKDAKIANVNSACEALGITGAKLVALRNHPEFGAEFTLNKSKRQ